MNALSHFTSAHASKALAFLVCLVVAAAMAPEAAAQRYDVTGVVVDTTGAPLPGATVVVITASDSTLTSFGTTRSNGEFQLRRVPSGDYVLQISFVGFQTYSGPVKVADAETNVGTITMSEQVTDLGELVVTEERIPIVVKADTVVYDASAFKVRAYANVEELLKRLPGIEVDRDGTITAQGETVQKILVDGKEFFGDDPKIATKNLPAEAVKSVEVFNKKSDMAEFTGVDDGQEQKTINLSLKDEHRRGYFGNVSGAYGANSRYDGRANINRFNSTTQVGLIANFSNVASQGFSSDEIIALGGFRGGGSNFSGGGGGGGLSTTASGGLNLNKDFGSKTSVRSSYFLNYADNLVDRDVMQQQLLGNSIGAVTTQNANNTALNWNHRLNLDVQQRFSPISDLRLRVRGQASTSDQLNVSSSEVVGTDASTQNSSNTSYDSNGQRIGGNARATYMYRFGASRRSIVAEVSGDLNDNETDADLKSLTEYYRDGNLLTSEELSQLQSNLSTDLTLRGQLSFTQPLGGTRYLELRAERRQTYEDQNQDIFDRVGDQLVFNDSLSSGYDRTYSYNQGRATLRWDGEDNDISFGASVQQSNLDGEISDFGVPINKSYVHLLPYARLRSDLGRGRTLYIRYSADTREPSIQQLQPIVNNTDPLNVYVGNPDLNPEYSHSLRGDFRWFDQFTFMNVFASIRTSYTKNQIVNARTVDENFKQTITPVNVDGDWSVSANTSFGTPLRPIGIQMNLSNGVTYGRSTEFVNANENDTRTLRDVVSLRLDNRNKDLVDVGVGGRFTFNVNRYSLNDELNQSYLNKTLFADFAVTPTPAWRFSTEVDATLYSEEVFGSGQNVVSLNAEISRSIMDNNRAQIVIAGRDLLDQSRGIDYTNSAGFVREEQVRSVGRYVLLKFVYNLSPTGGGGRGGFGGRGR